MISSFLEGVEPCHYERERSLPGFIDNALSKRNLGCFVRARNDELLNSLIRIQRNSYLEKRWLFKIM